MKKSMLSVIALLVCICSFGQDNNIKRPYLGLHFALTDFQSATDIRANGLAAVIRDKQLFKSKRMNPGLGLTYIQGVGQHLDFMGTLTGSILNYPVPNKVSDGSKKLLLEATAGVNMKLLTDKYIVVPYLSAGVGASKYRGYYAAIVPVGAGLQFKLSPDAFILLNTQYRIPVSENAAYHFYHSLGFVLGLTKPKVVPVVAPPPPPVVVLDRDGDGVLDTDDKCPDTPGLAALMGCPDRDGDGIADGDDKCPDVAGIAKYQGCPIPDTDGDGINDEMDKCPTVKGFARYQGCPIPDTDGDGVNDEEDKCPSRPGPASNQGCPEIAKEIIEKINFAAKNIFFSTGSFKLLPKSYKSLNEVASLMKADPSLLLDIDGHTDSQGSDEANHTLSHNRANAVAEYLTKQGVDASRFKVTGYGEEKPVADNKTAAGRAKNRRTEMTVHNY